MFAHLPAVVTAMAAKVRAPRPLLRNGPSTECGATCRPRWTSPLSCHSYPLPPTTRTLATFEGVRLAGRVDWKVAPPCGGFTIRGEKVEVMTDIYPELALGWRDSCGNRWSWTRFKCLSTGAAACPQTPLSSYPGASKEALGAKLGDRETASLSHRAPGVVAG